MAELSQETKAIIAELKNQGDLVRNSGTNSVRSVKMELTRFNDLFGAINNNISDQANMMKDQLGIAQDAAERAASEEQFNELSEPTSVESKAPKGDTDQAIEKMGDSITEALSFKNTIGTLKNVALAGAGMFAVYNFAKGFINEKYNGAWDNMEKGIGEMGPTLSTLPTSLRNAKTKLDEFATIDVQSIKDSLNTMKLAITELLDPETGSLMMLSNTIKGIYTSFNNFAARPIGATLDFVWENLGALGLAVAGLRWWFVRARLDLQNGTRPQGGVPWWRRALGLGAPTAPATITPRSQLSPADRLAQNRSLAQRFPDRFSLGPQGGLNDAATGRNATQAQINAALESQLTPKYAKALRSLRWLLGKIGLVMTAVELYQLLSVWVDPNLDDDTKIAMSAPIVGRLLGAVGGGVVGAAIATATGIGAGWGTLILGVVGAGVGYFAGDTLGTYVMQWLLDEAPPEQPSTNLNLETMSSDEILRAYGFNPDGTRAAPLDQGGYDMWQHVPQDYTDAYQDQTTGSASGSGRGSIVEQPGERAAYLRQREMDMLDALIHVQQEEQRKQEEQEQLTDEILQYLQKSSFSIRPGANRSSLINLASQGGGAGTFVVNSPVTNVSQPISVASGGEHVQVLNASFGGGGGGGGLMAYGLTSGLVA